MRGDSCIILNDSKKSVKWYSRNYFFATTFLVILINYIVFFAYGTPPAAPCMSSPNGTAFQ